MTERRSVKKKRMKNDFFCSLLTRLDFQGLQEVDEEYLKQNVFQKTQFQRNAVYIKNINDSLTKILINPILRRQYISNLAMVEWHIIDILYGKQDSCQTCLYNMSQNTMP